MCVNVKYESLNDLNYVNQMLHVCMNVSGTFKCYYYYDYLSSSTHLEQKWDGFFCITFKFNWTNCQFPFRNVYMSNFKLCKSQHPSLVKKPLRIPDLQKNQAPF